jgi:hypothetical protein
MVQFDAASSVSSFTQGPKNGMRLLIFAGVASGRHSTRQPLKKRVGDQGIINGHITCTSMLAQWLFADTSVIGVMPRAP